MKKLLFVSLLFVSLVGLRASEVPEEAELKAMTAKSLTSFGKAIKKQDFSGFYEDIAEVWQKQTSAEKLEAAFKEFLNKGVDIPSIVKEMKPVFNQPAAIDADGVLIIKGYYPTTPNRVIFQLKYLEEEDDWKLVGINVNMTE